MQNEVKHSLSLSRDGLLLSSARSARAAPNDNSALGINLGGVTYWSSEIVFVDLFKHSQTFKSQAPGKGYAQGGPLDLTADGWVRSLRGDGQFADSIVLSRPKLGYPAGVYTCLYEGKGKIQFAYRTKVVEESPGRIRVQVSSDQDLLTLRITETDPADPVRNIRVILPGFEDTYQDQPFHPDFLKRWEKFKVLRFMDLQRTNNSEPDPMVRPPHAEPADPGRRGRRRSRIPHPTGQHARRRPLVLHAAPGDGRLRPPLRRDGQGPTRSPT